jgi:Tfp pilus assembly protein PilV
MAVGTGYSVDPHMRAQGLKRRRIGTGISRCPKKSGAGGMGIIELLIAMTVLTVGMLGSMVMILVGMQSNTRNKNDTSAVVLDQEILEKFATLKNYPKTGTVNIYDCSTNGTNLHLASLVQGPSPTGNGATLYNAATAPTPGQVGDIDWTQAAPTLATGTVAGYAMSYQTCNGDIFEVRWNILQAPPCGSLATCANPTSTSRISLLTVSSRQISAAGNRNGMLFALPTTLRSLIEN